MLLFLVFLSWCLAVRRRRVRIVYLEVRISVYLEVRTATERRMGGNGPQDPPGPVMKMLVKRTVEQGLNRDFRYLYE